MPFRKFRSLEEMEDSLWREPGPALWSAIRGVWSLGARVGNQRFPRGVYKHRSIEAAKSLRESWDDANFRRFRNSRVEAAALKRFEELTAPIAAIDGVIRSELIRGGARRVRFERRLADGWTRLADASFVPKESSGMNYSFDVFFVHLWVFKPGQNDSHAKTWGDVDFAGRLVSAWIGDLCAWEDLPIFQHPELPARNPR